MSKSLLLEDEDHESFKKSAMQCGLTLKEYVTLCCSNYSRLGINPKNQANVEELRNIFVSFIREQERRFHNETLKKVNYIANEIGKMELVLNNISHDVKVVKAKKE